MGRFKIKQGAWSDAGFNITRSIATTGTIIANRVGSLTTAGEFRHTTGTSGRRVIGVAITTGNPAMIQLFGIATLQAGTAAIQKGMPLVATSGAVSATDQRGGTVKTISATTILNRRWCCALSLSSAAASTAARSITAFLTPIGAMTTQTVG